MKEGLHQASIKISLKKEERKGGEGKKERERDREREKGEKKKNPRTGLESRKHLS